MPGTLVFDKDKGLREGITQAGNTLGKVLDDRNRAELKQRQVQENRDYIEDLARRNKASNIEDSKNQGTIMNQVLLKHQDENGSIPNKPMLNAAFMEAGVSQENTNNFFKNTMQTEKTPKETLIQKGMAKDILSTLDSVSDLRQSTEDVSRLRSLQKQIQYPFPLGEGSINPLTRMAATKEFEAIGTTSIKSALKIFNPTGQLAIGKLKMIMDTHAVKASDSRQEAEGKIKAVERFSLAANNQLSKLNALIEEYGEDIPTKLWMQYKLEGDEIINSMLPQNQQELDNTFDGLTEESAKLFKGRTTTSKKTGKTFRSNGKTWVQEG